MVFTTVPGVNYRVDWTYDLVNWTREEELYGLGFEFAVAMREIEAAPPPPEPDPGDPPPTPPGTSAPVVRVSLLFREASGQTPGTVVSWRSLDHGGPANHFLPLVMTSGWSQMPFFWNTYGDHDFFIGGYGGVAAPPDPVEAHGPLDAAMIACLEEHFAEINAEIDQSVARARNTPPPAPPAPDAKRFWRIFCDASLDTDGDGSPDWAEYEMAANGTGVMVEGVTPDPFAADSNGDGIPDGEQLDYDGDGTSDAQDIGMDDATATYEIGRVPRYALFPLTNASPPADLPDPLEINDRGEVLYANGIWQGGIWTQLSGAVESDTTWVRAVRINDHGEVIGVVKSDFTGQNGITIPSHEFPGNVVYWPDRNSWCMLVEQGGNGAWMGSPLLGYPGNPGIRFSNNGIIMANSRRFDAAANGSLVDDGGFLWTLAGNGRNEGREPVSLHDGGALDAGTYWGYPGGSDSAARLITDGATLEAPGGIRNVIPDGKGGVVVSFTNAPTGYVREGEWRTATVFAPAIDVNADGIGIGNSHGGLTAPILLNGRWRGISRCAPELPAQWTGAGVNHLDTTPGGWILAADSPSEAPAKNHAVMLPLKLEPPLDQDQLAHTKWDGVDGVSVGAITPPAPVRDSLWVMAPLGDGQTRCLLKAPLAAGTPLKLSAGKLRFNGNTEATLTSGENVVTISAAPGQTIESGSEEDITLHLGPVASASKPLRAKFMKHRTVKVNLYHVPLGETAPDFSFTHEQVASLLTNTFRPKLNLDFDVRPVVTLPGNWDADGDDAMDAYPEDSVHPEQQSTLASRPENAPESNIDIFLMSGNRFMVIGSKYGDVPAEGVTNRALRCCWINANTLANPEAPGSGRTHGEVSLTLIHEVGHIFAGYGHPDEEDGAAPLKGTDRSVRLMHSGDKGRGGRLGTMLVKQEWDEAEAWLHTHIDSPTP